MRYIGDRGGAGGAGGALSYIDYFAAAPGNGWKALSVVTEFDIFKLRRSGAIPAQPRVLASRGRSATLATAAAVQYNSPGARPNFAIGPEMIVSNTGQLASPNMTITAAMLNENKAPSSLIVFNTSGAIPTGLCFVGKELNIFVAGGLMAGVPNVPLGNSATAFSPTSYTHPGGNQNQLCFGAGVFVAWQIGGGSVLRYSADRVTWANCSVAGLNADGGASGATPAWVIFDPVQQKFIMCSVYGEIEESVDGITFTKTSTRAAGGTTYGLTEFCVTKDGVVLAVGTGAAAGQYYTAPSNAGPFSLATVAIAGKTFSSRAQGIGYTAGVTFFSFNASATTTDVQTAFSRDERLTYEFGAGSDGTKSGSDGANTWILASAGVSVTINATSGSVTMLGDRLTTDWGNLIAAAVHNDFYTVPTTGGTQLQSYIKVA